MSAAPTRRALLAAGAAFAALPAAATNAAGWRKLSATYEITLPTEGRAAQLWLPLPATTPWQRAGEVNWSGSTTRATIVTLPGSDARVLRAVFAGEGARTLRATVAAETLDRAGPAAAEADPAPFLAASASIPTDGIVAAKAAEIVGSRTEPADKARAIYDWIVDNTFRDPQTRGCGLGDIAYMLETGDLGGKCADLNSLFVGLARAAGLPAREWFGMRAADSAFSPSLGRGGDITRAQHCRAEVFIAGQGWFPVDPADVRKIILEEKVAVDSDRARLFRERLFGNWEMNWVAFNTARDFALPGGGPLPTSYMMYPEAKLAGAWRDCFDPDGFAYRITSA